MRILTVLTYYRPHTSGLTIYAERLAKALVRRGHQVTILTSQYEKHLPLEEVQEAVRIRRSPVLLRVSKGVISPALGFLATQLVRESDVIQLHLPQFDAPGVALRGRLTGRPTVLTYHCDLSLPPTLFNRLVNRVVDVANHTAAQLADRIVTYTQDYADNSPYLSRYRSKLQIIPPPVELPKASPEAVEAFARQNRTEECRPVIGMAARFAAEKGVEVLLDALPAILERYPRAQVLFAGQYQNVLSEEAYFNRLAPQIRRYEADGHWRFLGVLSPQEMAAFYPNLDVLVVPSLNSTEAFGLVQIEAMMNGVPCVASALPGVRQPVLTTGMGRVTPIGDSRALAQAILEIVDRPQDFQADPQEIAHRFDPDTIAAEYERMFLELLRAKKKQPAG
ncbi:MAG: glycosyltransferase family 4 protein [Chloroflexi bacterium]|jgi:glycosyltransferase involved in cell wall biosynthesis|nr:glycosyltransferase family 4 protein [Chloroflexota bacterium]